jgi:hypothetical protein
MGYWMDLNGYNPVNGDRMITIDEDCEGLSNTAVTAPDPVVTTIWHWVSATGTMYEYTVTINEAGIIISAVLGKIKLGIGLGIGI